MRNLILWASLLFLQTPTVIELKPGERIEIRAVSASPSPSPSPIPSPSPSPSPVPSPSPTPTPSPSPTPVPPIVGQFAIGVPNPGFGLAENPPAYNSQNPNHYWVNNKISPPYCTNSGRGTSSLPRCSFPTNNLPAGSLVELHGGPYNTGSSFDITATGTFSNPVFIRGNVNQKPKIARPVWITGQYLVIENLDIDAWTTSNDAGVSFASSSHHVAIRNSEVHNGPRATTAGIFIGGVSNIVIANSSIHDNGSWQVTTGDEDHHGIGIDVGASYVWVVNNKLYHNSGDGLQIDAYGGTPYAHHVYIARNLVYENKQTGLWSKNSKDVVMSQNEVYGHKPSSSSTGTGIGFQTNPSNLWIIFNNLHDNTHGVLSGSDGGARGNIYIVGNWITNVSGDGVQINGSAASHYVVNNTIRFAKNGITNAYYQAKIIGENNLLLGITVDSFNFCGDSATKGLSSLRNNAIYKTSSPCAPSCVGCFTLPNETDLSIAANNGYASGVYNAFKNYFGLSIYYDFAGKPRGSLIDIGAIEGEPF